MENGVETGHDWSQIWMVPAGLAVAVLILFLIFFKEEEKIV